MSTINWGIIGCGNVTEKKSGPAFSKVEGSNLKAVMRRNGEKAKDYATRHNVEKWYDDADQMMDEAGIDAVYIATPPANHLEYAISALKRGLPVYVEKPVTRNAVEAEQMAAAVKQYNGRLTVAHYRRGVPMFLFIKDLLQKQVIGDIRTIQIRLWQSRKPGLVADVETNWRVNPAISGGGYFHDLAPHQLDLLLYWFGEPEYYTGFSLNQSGIYQADDNVNGQIVFKNKIVVSGSWCFDVAEQENIDLCEIVGTKGKISFAFFGTYVRWYNEHEQHHEEFTHPQHIQQPMIERIVAYLNGKGPNPCTIEEAIVTMKIIDAFTGRRF